MKKAMEHQKDGVKVRGRNVQAVSLLTIKQRLQITTQAFKG